MLCPARTRKRLERILSTHSCLQIGNRSECDYLLFFWFFWTPAPHLGCQHTSWQASSELGRHTFLSRHTESRKKPHEAVALPARASSAEQSSLPAAIACPLPKVPQPPQPERGTDHFHKGRTSGNLPDSLVHLGRVQLSQAIPFPLFSTHPPMICSQESCK